MIEYDKKRNPKSLDDSQIRMKNEIKKIVPSSGNLRDCLISISDKYPWSDGKYKVMLALSFILRVFRGSLLYSLDVFTDIQFLHWICTDKPTETLLMTFPNASRPLKKTLISPLKPAKYTLIRSHVWRPLIR